MKKLLILTLFGLMAIGCAGGDRWRGSSSKDSTMTYSPGTQAELDAANRRIDDYRQELLQQGFHQVSAFHTNTTGGAIANSKEEFVLEGQYGKLKDLRVRFWTTKLWEKDQDQPQFGGGVKAAINDAQADRDFEELYKKVSFVVTGNTQ